MWIEIQVSAMTCILPHQQTYSLNHPVPSGHCKTIGEHSFYKKIWNWEWCYSNQVNDRGVVVEYLVLLSEIILSENIFFPLQGNGYSPTPLDLSNVALSRELQVRIRILHTLCRKELMYLVLLLLTSWILLGFMSVFVTVVMICCYRKVHAFYVLKDGIFTVHATGASWVPRKNWAWI